MTDTTHSNIPEAASPWLTVAEIARFDKCSEKLIYAAIKRGQLRAAKIGVGRGAWRIHRDWNTAWLNACAEPVEVDR